MRASVSTALAINMRYAATSLLPNTTATNHPHRYHPHHILLLHHHYMRLRGSGLSRGHGARLSHRRGGPCTPRQPSLKHSKTLRVYPPRSNLDVDDADD